MSEHLTDPKEVYEHRDAVQLVDVREPYEWEAGRIEGALHIPLNRLLAGQTEDIEPGKPVVAYCRSGQRSEVAKLMLQARGFEAYNMEGGTESWVESGLPFSAPDGSPGRVA